MSELIGQVNPDFRSRNSTPDLDCVSRDLVKLDQQARLLEDSGIAEVLRCTVDSVPGTSFYYNDLVGLYPDPRPGYVIEKDNEIGVVISSDGNKIYTSCWQRKENSVSYRHDGPIIKPDLNKADPYKVARFDPSSLVEYFCETGLVTSDPNKIINSSLHVLAELLKRNPNVLKPTLFLGG